MSSHENQDELFPEDARTDDGIVYINDRCRLQRRDGFCVVSVCGVVLAHFAKGDRMGEAHAMVSLVEQGLARQRQVARVFGYDERTVRRHMRRYESGGLAALGRGRGYPRGQPRLSNRRRKKVNQWKAEGVSNREIARRLGVDEKAVRKLLRQLGWKTATPQQLSIPVTSADPKLSGSANRPTCQKLSRAERAPVASAQAAEIAAKIHEQSADPKLSGSSEPMPVAIGQNPDDRTIDRVLACLGLLDDAAPVFGSANKVSGVGVLLCVPAIIDSGVLDIARSLYGDIAPAFYGLRTTIMMLILMALLRIKRPEGLKEHSPRDLGRLLGLDRAPEVKTLRRKLRRMAASGLAKDFGRALAERRVADRGHAMGFLYVDGHVRAYHGKRTIPKTHLARMRLSMPATTDYWVNDAEGEPLLLVTTEAHKGLVKMLPLVLKDVRELVGERRVTIVFDRGGWSPKLFKELITDGFDIMTYRKGRFRRVGKKYFQQHRTVIDGRKICYTLADGGTRLKNSLRLRQVTRLTDDGHQTPIVTSRRDLSAVEVAYRMFNRWRQENFFKYLREEYALDVLVDYDTEPADSTREAPNPARKAINAKIREAYAKFGSIAATLGLEVATNEESLRRTMRGFKIANSDLARHLNAAANKVAELEKKRRSMPTRVPISKVVDGDIVKLSVERKFLTDLFKMVAYQAESDLVRQLAPHYKRAEAEGRTFVQTALAQTGDIRVMQNELQILLEPMSSPHRTQSLTLLCEQINKREAKFPGSKLRLRFAVKPQPLLSAAFPGSREPKRRRDYQKPDIYATG